MLILPPAGSPVVFQHGETYPLSENPDREELWPTESTITSTHSDGPAAEQGEDALSRLEGSASSTTDASTDVDPSGDGVEAFAAMYVRHVEGTKIPQDHVFQAYDTWTEQHDIDGTTKGWFTRKLREVVDLDTDRSRVDGERIQYYTGLTLTQDGQALRDQ